MDLHASQRAALDHVTKYARGRKMAARQAISHILRMTDISIETFEAAVSNMKSHARVGLHFHPDRPCADMSMVAQSLLACGVYKSQFETQLSSGSVSAFPGGDRDNWEKRLFGGAYQREGSANGHRPKYGALDLMLYPDGPAPRFGSCYFLLRPEVSRRCTYTYLDSHEDPKEKGTFDEFDDVVAALLTEVFFRESALGEKNLTVRRMVEHLLTKLGKSLSDPSEREPVRNLNHYIEAQVHGDIRLEDDVDVLVADPSFKDSDVGKTLHRLSERYGFELRWHRGFTLPVSEVPSDFRGPTMPSLAERLSIDGSVDVSMIGKAAMALRQDPGAWSDRGSYSEVLQELKLLWHVLVRFGHPRTGSLSPTR